MDLRISCEGAAFVQEVEVEVSFLGAVHSSFTESTSFFVRRYSLPLPIMSNANGYPVTVMFMEILSWLDKLA